WWRPLPGRDGGALLLALGAHCRRFPRCPQAPPLVSLCRIRAYLWPLIHEGTQRTTLDTLSNQSDTQSDKFLAVTALSRSHAEKPKEPGSRGKISRRTFLSATALTALGTVGCSTTQAGTGPEAAPRRVRVI